MKELDLPFLRAFALIYELRSVTAAAARLHRTQPSVTYQLRQLERALGAPLFVRGRPLLVPTALADRLYRLATGFAQEVRAARAGRETDARVEIASVSGFGRYVLMPRILALRPPPAVSIRFPTADEVLRRVHDGEVEIGFTYRSAPRPGLRLEPVHVETFVLLAPPALARRLKRRRDFRDVPLVTYDEGDYVLGRWLGHHFGRRTPSWHSVSHCEELEEVLALVEAGVGAAVVPDFRYRRSGRVAKVTWNRPAVVNTVFSVRRAGAVDRPVVTRLIGSLGKFSR